MSVLKIEELEQEKIEKESTAVQLNQHESSLQEQEIKIKELNQINKDKNDAKPDFTRNVHSLVDSYKSKSNMRSSLDFEFQKNKSVSKDGKIRYDSSQ